MPELIITGGSQLMRVAAHLVEAEAGLKREVRASLRAACQPLLGEIRDGMMAESLPVTGKASSGSHGGGRNQRFQASMDRRKKTPSEAMTRKLSARSGLRASIAAGVGMNIGLNPNAPYVKIRVNTGNLPNDQRGIPRAIEKGHWRHPVFGNSENWVVQHGEPFFFPPIHRAIPRIEAEVALVSKHFVETTAGRPVR